MVNSQSAPSSQVVETITIDGSDDSSEAQTSANVPPTPRPPTPAAAAAAVDMDSDQCSISDLSTTDFFDAPEKLPSDKGPTSDQTQGTQNQASTSVTINFTYGPYVPIFKRENDIIIEPKGIIDSYYGGQPDPIRKRMACEVLPDDTIFDAPSIVVPLMLKKKNILPPRSVRSPSAEPLTDVDRNSDENNRTSPQSADANHADANKQAQSTKDDDFGQNQKPVEDYIRASCVASLAATNKKRADQPILAMKDYYKSSVGEMLLGIGLSRAREVHLRDSERKLIHKIKKNEENFDNLELLEALRSQLNQAELCNKPYKSTSSLKCPLCPFKAESAIVMDGHLEFPHKDKKDFLCNWCDYRTNESALILYHCLVKHQKRCLLEKPAPLHLCPFCSFGHKDKRRLRNHLVMCEKMFESNNSFLGPQNYGETDYPAVTSKLITREDIRVYENTLKNLRLAAYNPHQIKVSGLQQNNNLPILVVPRTYVQTPARFVASNIPRTASNAVPSLQRLNKDQIGNLNGVTTQNNHSAQLLQILSGQSSNQIRGGTLQYPRTYSNFINGNLALRTASNFVMAPPNAPCFDDVATRAMNTDDLTMNEEQTSSRSNLSSKSSTSSPKGSTFVICEICDGYIKDLGQLKSHMQWIHKVKIHQKMLISRPPLNCQKCPWRFFTDQGLERHLLGAHGLVTSNMQETVDKGSDSGRCTICGKAFANKLVAHMKEAHKLSLKPAHLTYKCTVCSATFNLYRLFENHVYSVHSDSVRRISAS